MKNITYTSLVLIVIVTGCDFISSKAGLWLPNGVVLKNNDNYGEAHTALQQHRGLDALDHLQCAANEGYRHPLIYLKLASHNGALKKYEEAFISSQKAVEILESDEIQVMFRNELKMLRKKNKPQIMAEAYSLHARILYELGRFPDASVYAQKATDLNPEDPGVREVSGKLAVINGEYEKAITIFQNFINTSPRYYSAYFYLGKALLLNGRTAEGISALNNYIAEVPASHANVEAAKALLTEYK